MQWVQVTDYAAGEVVPVKLSDMSDPNEYSALRSGALIIDRSDRLRMRFGGPKAAEMLNGLVTNDVLALTPGHGLYAAALTPKGKIAADLRIFADEEGLLTDTSARASLNWRDIVRKFINPRIAPYRDISAETRDVALYGPRARMIVAKSLGVDDHALAMLHPHAHAATDFQGGKVRVIRIADIEAEGFEIIIPSSLERALRDKLLGEGAIAGSNQTWNIARIEAGHPEWGIDMNDMTIPQEANFDSLNAISYTKGCYTGQETVARVHFRGHVNKFLRRVHFVSATVPPTNAELVDDSGNVVGDVRSVAMSPRFGGVAIAMVRREVASGATLHARWAGGECTVQIAA
jgi:folate-binding protein YgfZ